LDLILLVAEYVSCYFRFSEYGHPAVLAFEKLEKSTMPYGGIDTRVFATKPHITIIGDPLLPSSEVLQLETDEGLYYRYVLDTFGSVKSDLRIFDLAAVLVRQFRSAAVSRGLRGASGSGRGVRTLVEFATLLHTYFHDARTGHITTQFEYLRNQKSNAGERRQQEEVVDQNAEDIRIKSTFVPEATCLIPPVSLPKFTKKPCDIVICYEDLMFCFDTMKTFFGSKDSDCVHESNANSKVGKGAKATKIDLGKAATPSAGTEASSLFGVLSIIGLRVIIVDNVLGLHLPLMQVRV
jgi:hypothetical protein